jgi:hypothetical protein
VSLLSFALYFREDAEAESLESNIAMAKDSVEYHKTEVDLSTNGTRRHVGEALRYHVDKKWIYKGKLEFWMKG